MANQRAPLGAPPRWMPQEIMLTMKETMGSVVQTAIFQETSPGRFLEKFLTLMQGVLLCLEDKSPTNTNLIGE